MAEFAADLDPKAAWKQTVKFPAGESYTVQVLDRNGHPLLEHEEGWYAATGPTGLKLGPQKVIDWNARMTEWKLRKRGEYNESVSQNAFARYDYTGGLQEFSGDSLLEKAEGRLAVSLLRFDEASERLDKLTTQPRPDPEVLYYAGVAQSLAGHDDAARPLLIKAGSSPLFAAPAAVELALIASRARDFPDALRLPEPAADDPLRGARVGGIRAALLRRSGDRAAAVRELDKWRAVAPEDPFLRYEGTLAGKQDPALWSYLAGDGERVLNLADEYLRLGMWEDALACLKHDFSKDNPKFLEPGAVPPNLSALLVYYRAYCEIALKMDAAADLRRAAELGTRYMFPNRATSYAVLRAAIERNPSDATAHALMGNLAMYSFRTEDAIAEWQQAVTLNPKLEVEREDLAKAIELGRRKPEPVLSTTAAEKPVAPSGPVRRESAKAPAPSNPATSASAAALADSALLDSVSGSADSAAAVFRGAAFAAEKQPPSVRQAYIEVQLQSLLALSVSGKCDTLEDRIEGLSLLEDSQVPFIFHGFSEFMKTAHFQYYLGVAEANCGRTKQARKYWSKVAKMNAAPSSPDFGYPLLAASKVDSAQAKGAIADALKTLEGQGALDAGLRALDQAILLRASGQEGPAAGQFSNAQQSNDVMVRYLAEIELTRKPR
jgi:tetratricopeptide (TPR) repeat protein